MKPFRTEAEKEITPEKGSVEAGEGKDEVKAILPPTKDKRPNALPKTL
jgi:hypothetical protein